MSNCVGPLLPLPMQFFRRMTLKKLPVVPALLHGTAGCFGVSPAMLRRTSALYFPTGPPGSAAPPTDVHYDPMEGVRRDAAAETSRKKAEVLLRTILPAGAPPAAFTKAHQYLAQHSIDDLITSPKIQVTHIENADGVEEKTGGPVCTLAEALQRAKEAQLNLVVMGTKGDTSFCRIRNEKKHLLHLVKKEIESAAELENSSAAAPKKTKNMIHHSFRDVVDAHFIGWKSKKIIADLKKGHPVKLVIREFQNWEGALLKLQEMCRAMERVGKSENFPHHFTSIAANNSEVSVLFSPPTSTSSHKSQKTVIKYPSQREWDSARQRMEESCRKSGRYGTYVKTGPMKPRSLGETTYRVDKYGRRIE